MLRNNRKKEAATSDILPMMADEQAFFYWRKHGYYSRSGLV